jgi:hypothetical protein
MELIDTVVLPSDSIARLFLSLSEASIVLGAPLLFSALTSEKICRQSGPFVRSSEKRAPTPDLGAVEAQKGEQGQAEAQKSLFITWVVQTHKLRQATAPLITQTTVVDCNTANRWALQDQYGV